MKYNWTVTAGTLSEEEMAYFKKAAPAGFKPTGEALTVEYREEQNRDWGSCTYAVMTGKNWTPYGMCRDCGDHYIIANWSSYDRIEKGTLVRTHDVEDK